MTEYKREKPKIFIPDDNELLHDYTYHEDNYTTENHLAEALRIVNHFKVCEEWNSAYRDQDYDKLIHNIRMAWDKSK